MASNNNGFDGLIDVVDNPSSGDYVDKIDTTGDGIADVYTYDNNNDGIADYFSGDTNGDGVTDMQLQDTDFDGKVESGWGEENWTAITDSDASDMTVDDVTLNQDYSLDSDHDGRDHDGLTNVDEYESGLDASLADSDGDHFSDSDELYMETDPTDWQRDGPDRLAKRRVGRLGEHPGVGRLGRHIVRFRELRHHVLRHVELVRLLQFVRQLQQLRLLQLVRHVEQLRLLEQLLIDSWTDPPTGSRASWSPYLARDRFGGLASGLGDAGCRRRDGIGMLFRPLR